MSQSQLDRPHGISATEISGRVVEIAGISLSYRSAVFVCQVMIGVLLLGGWEFGAGSLFDEFWFSKPSAIMMRLLEGLTSGGLLRDTWITSAELMLGFVIGVPAGMTMGLLLGANGYLRKIMAPFMIAAYSVPVIALAPLFILWFGIGLLPKIIIVALTVYFLVFFNVFFGIKEVDKELVESIRVVGGNHWQVLQKVLLPATLPWAFAGIRIGIPYAVIAAVVAEMIGARAGLGHLIVQASGVFNTTTVFVAVGVLTLLALVLDRAAAFAEKRLLRWRHHWAEGDRE